MIFRWRLDEVESLKATEVPYVYAVCAKNETVDGVMDTPTTRVYGDESIWKGMSRFCISGCWYLSAGPVCFGKRVTRKKVFDRATGEDKLETYSVSQYLAVTSQLWQSLTIRDKTNIHCSFVLHQLFQAGRNSRAVTLRYMHI